MTDAAQAELLHQAKMHIAKRHDPTHDFDHHMRVWRTASHIARHEESGDEDILMGSSLLHDVVIYPKHSAKADQAPDSSAALAGTILERISGFPQAKISSVMEAIVSCSYSKNVPPPSIEAAILQDADLLEATGAIAIMRTFGYSGVIGRPFYNPEDPFARGREPDSSKWALDLFFNRLLLVHERMHTKTAQELARQRTQFLHSFLEELKLELDEIKRS